MCQERGMVGAQRGAKFVGADSQKDPIAPVCAVFEVSEGVGADEGYEDSRVCHADGEGGLVNVVADCQAFVAILEDRGAKSVVSEASDRVGDGISSILEIDIEVISFLAVDRGANFVRMEADGEFAESRLEGSIVDRYGDG